MDNTDNIVAITDPGEVGRAEHTRGDRIVVHISNLFAWIFPILMVAICAQVVLRTAGFNQAWLDDFQWWLYGAAVLIGIGYAVTTNSHVRVDIRYENFTPEKKLRTDIMALAWLFLPFVILSWDVTLSYAIISIASDEGSDSPNGLHNLWILKTFMNVSFLFIAFATWTAYVRTLAKLIEPLWWRKLFWALPSTMFVINLIIYYAVWWAIYLTSPEGTTTRDVGRHWVFDEIEVGNYDIKYTIIATVLATAVVIGVARLLARPSKA
ncbi:TRAP transporter small permease subunit [Aestuariivita boseongensis]|uniref:TRAP transporter small permease subunit n=1 Tax=Aestuariivita boseongensis TaxID=1470562 RepID=UPI0006824557|nr:TRAP transporter small permease subunit [Aestuariivita boseongensis]